MKLAIGDGPDPAGRAAPGAVRVHQQRHEVRCSPEGRVEHRGLNAYEPKLGPRQAEDTDKESRIEYHRAREGAVLNSIVVLALPHEGHPDNTVVRDHDGRDKDQDERAHRTRAVLIPLSLTTRHRRHPSLLHGRVLASASTPESIGSYGNIPWR